MRRLFATADRSPTVAPSAVFAMLAIALSIWFQSVMYVFLVFPHAAMYVDVPLQLVLLAAFGVTCFAWMSLHAFGYVGSGSGAGFRLVCIGFASRVCVSLMITTTGVEADQSIYDGLPRVVAPIWLVRNVSLVTIGCGFMLVVLASGADLARRRVRPRWMPVND